MMLRYMQQIIELRDKNKLRPFSRLSLTGFGLTLATLLIAVAAPIGSRVGVWSFNSATEILTWAAYFAVAAVIFCVMGVVRAWPGSRYRGFFLSLIGTVILIPTIAVPAYWANAKREFPPIQDITTDTENPPEFWHAPNSRVYGGVGIAVLQEEAYPDIEPYLSPLTRNQTFNLVIEVIQDFDWQLWGPNREDGHIEATETTFWFGFSDDVSIHITALDEGSQVDVRSASRFGGGGDGGTNANRIRTFLKALDKRVKLFIKEKR